MCNEHVVMCFSRGIGAVSSVYFSPSRHISYNLAQLAVFFLVYGKRMMPAESYTLRFTLCPQTLAAPVSQMFWGCKIKKVFACQPPCIFKGLSFIG